MTEEALLFEVTGAIARLTLNRPKAMNAMNMALLAELDRRLALIAADDAIRVLVVTGTGTGAAFCAGADLKEVLASQNAEPGEADFLDRADATFACLRNFPKPVIAALNGVTMAGGLELAMCADIVIAGESATIGDAHANFGVYPGAGGAAVLPRLVPQNVAMYLLLTGKTLSAGEMKAYGFISEVHPDGELAEASMKLASQIAGKSPVVLQRMKKVARASADKTRDDALLHEQVMLRRHLRSFDLQEGLQAFAEKRAPQFQGR